MKKVLICIDDTDNLESVGTGELLENICSGLEAAGLGRGGFITRHQLYLSDRIAYTSHNSCMCAQAETKDVSALVSFAAAYLEEHAAPGSDPGLCVLDLEGVADTAALTVFGRRAQSEVLTKAEARALADRTGLYLSEHGGTGDGVIGALAGVGLRLSGNDGRIRGKLFPKHAGEVLTAAEACRRYGAGQVLGEGTALPGETALRFDGAAKAVLRDGMVTLLAGRREGTWVLKPKEIKEKKRNV